MYKRKSALAIIAAASLFLTACAGTGGTPAGKQNGKDGIRLKTDNLDTKMTEAKPDFDNFKVKKIDGTETDIYSVLSGADLTVVNIWEPSLKSYQNELEDFASLSSEYSGKGIQIVGIIKGVTKEQDQAASQDIISKAGAKYLQLLDSDDLKQLIGNQDTKLPATLFFGSDGKQLGKTYNGARDKAFWDREILSYHSKACGDGQTGRAVG